MALTKAKVDRVLPEIVCRLGDALKPVAVYLFGSCVEDALGPDSDIDILVIVAESELSFFERGAAAVRALRGADVPIDMQVYTGAEFDSRADLPVSFERTVRTKGRLLYAA